MKVTTPQANRIYNFLKGLWVQKDLNWIPSVKAAPVKTGKSVTWIRDALVGVGINQNVFNTQKLLILLERLWRGPVVTFCSKPISKVESVLQDLRTFFVVMVMFEMNLRSQPPPNLPEGPAHKLAGNYYYSRDLRRNMAPPKLISSYRSLPHTQQLAARYIPYMEIVER